MTRSPCLPIAFAERPLARALRGETVRDMDYRVIRKDGSRRQLLVGAAPIYDQENRLNAGVLILRDVTEQRQAVEEGERRLERLAENSNDLITIVDANGVIISCMGPVKRIVGYAPEELIGRSGFELMHPDDRSRVTAALQATVNQPGTVQFVEYRFRHKNGGWIAMEAVGTNWLDESNIGGIVLNIRDISQRKEAEIERVKLQEQLQHALKMEAIGRLTGGVAHDFNNLLTVIQGNVELALEGVRPPDPLHQNLSEIASAAGSACALTRQLLAFSRRQVIEPKVICLNGHLAELKKMLRRLLGEDVALDLILAQNLGAVRADPGQLEQVVVNLAVNARDSMPAGGWLRIETANIELDGTYCGAHPNLDPGPFVMMAVSDSGQGMTPEVKQRIFEPFFTTKLMGHGTGLGLATIFGITQQAGGGG